jgi:hypothetical protein
MNIEDIRWGSYKNFEGPWTAGEAKYKLPEKPSEEEMIMAVITATEGGRYDAVNMYDSCLWTAGIIQWCNRAPQRSVDKLIGVVARAAPSSLGPLKELAGERGYVMRGGDFYVGGSMVDDVGEQKKLYFQGSTGEKKQWQDEDKEWAKRWCLATQQVLADSRTHQAQVKYTLTRMVKFFAYKAGKEVLSSAPKSPVGQAWKALYLSFAANNPAKAAAAVEEAVRDSAGRMEPWTEPWLANMARHLTFDPGISIYPHRYNKIRPVIEKLWGVDLPDTAADVAKWREELKISEQWLDPLEMQRALIALDFDLGPKGADGVLGKKTRDALLHLERVTGVPEEHQDGMPDRYTLPRLEKALQKYGIEHLS